MELKNINLSTKKLMLLLALLPRNFLGGLSRSPAAGSTTQRSSTSLKNKQAHIQQKYFSLASSYFHGLT